MNRPITPAAEARLGVTFWLTTAFAIGGIAAACALGAWQLDRAAQKEALHASIEERKLLPVLYLQGQAAIDNVADVVHRQAVVRGRWRAGDTVYLDNRQMHGVPGFYVLTPLQPEDGGPAIVVQRGWVQRDFMDRAHLPAVDTPNDVLVEVLGRIATPPSKLLELGPSGALGEGSSRIRQNLDLRAYADEIHTPVRADLTLVQTGAASEGLQRDWPEVQTGVAKHYGYAVQWFALSGLIAFLYVWFQIVRRFRGTRR